MYFEQYGQRENPIVVFLHGAFFVHSFGRQYPLSEKYCLLIPHLPGFGREAKETFEASAVVSELAQFIRELGRPVTLVGFSLGAQLAVKLLAEHPELFNGAVIVSPWLIKDEGSLEEAYRANSKQVRTMKNRFMCRIIGLMNGLPGPQRDEFVEQMQQVSEQTLRNVVYNGIDLDSVEDFARVEVPVVVLAGGKEQARVINSARCLEHMNPNCRVEVWPKAAHNIPPLFRKRFNSLLEEFVDSVSKDA